ncbi:hypothetical protein GCM10023214_27250 [Amycolatopsis dongchuanensis]|uniref:DUF4352 domain-containing protein n=1 Tax=Amycolatopsis dongchuanensis TaxID=1070866 RepID=A0ABP9QGZ0_9PSEU
MLVASFVVALVAALAAVAAVAYARGQKVAADRSATASERAATAAELSAKAALTAEERALRSEQDMAAMQARLVTSEVIYPTPSEEVQGFDFLRIEVKNHSDAPVHLPRIAELRNSSAWVTGFQIGWKVVEDYTDSYRDPEVLGPGESHRFPAEFVIDESKLPKGATWEPTAVVISFTDARGVRWRRTGNEEPRREL